MGAEVIRYNFDNTIEEPFVDNVGCIWIPTDLTNNSRILRLVIDKVTDQHLTLFRCLAEKDEDDIVRKYGHQYDFSIKDNKTIMEVQPGLFCRWLEDIISPDDFNKNPNNVSAWDYVFDGQSPRIYQSDRLFQCSNGDMYLNTEFGWVMLDSDWLVCNQTILREDIRQEYLMIQNLRTFG
jgi:hypothetical protein